MKKNIFILLCMFILLTGCSSEYNLTFGNNKIKENIKATILDSDIPVLTPEEAAAGISLDDPITPFIENDQYPYLNNFDIIYDKKVDKTDNLTTINFDYIYDSIEDYKKSAIYNSCFENSTISENRNGYSISFNGKFYCLYGNELTINVKSNNEVISSNADKVSGNTYTWKINKNNSSDVDIHMEISKRANAVNYTITIILAIIGVILVVVGLFVYSKIKNRENVNEI